MNATDNDAPTPLDQCVENSCSPLSMDASHAGVTCSQNLVLKTIDPNTCTARCANGFYGDDGAYVCNPTTLKSETTMSCLEIICASITFPRGMIGTNCSASTLLTTTTNPTCSVSCDIGYESIGEGILQCPLNATFGQAVESFLQCIPLKCAPLSIPSYALSGTF